MNCFPWFQYAESADTCLAEALLQNFWTTDDELAKLDSEGMKSLLIERLARELSPVVHTVVDLSLREVSTAQGGLCGLAALYQAMDNTVLTKSQLKITGYEDIRAIITQEMLSKDSATKDLSDADLLMHFYDCKLDDYLT